MRLLIADSSEGFRRILADQLRKGFEVHTASDGMQALALLRRLQPDILVLDLHLAQLDGLTLLETAGMEGLRPMVLALSPLLSDFLMDKLQRLRVDDILCKPCSISAVVRRVSQFAEKLQQEGTVDTGLERRAVELLRLLGVAPNLSGTRYLQRALELKVHSPQSHATKELYPVISREFSVGDPRLVERSIRNAIEKAWKSRNDLLWQFYFPVGEDGTVKKPSNTEFISRLAQLLRLAQP